MSSCLVLSLWVQVGRQCLLVEAPGVQVLLPILQGCGCCWRGAAGATNIQTVLGMSIQNS